MNFPPHMHSNTKKGAAQHPQDGVLERTLAHVAAALEQDDSFAKPSDHSNDALEQNILFNIRRHLGCLSWLIDTHASGRVRPRTRRVLLWAMTELLFLNGAASHAIVDTAVHFVKRRYSPQEAGFVNAFLRRITEQHSSGTDVFAEAPEQLRLEMPDDLWTRWCATYGEDAARAMAESALLPAAVILRGSPDAAPLPLSVGAKSLPAPDWAPAARLVELPSGTGLALSTLLRDHPNWYVQDPATLLAPALLAPLSGEHIADLCAAPGGKSRILAEMLNGTGMLYCRDRAHGKLDRLRKNLSVFSRVDIACADATSSTFPPNSLDGVLLDVPCSNTGVLRRKPDAKWRFSDASLQELTALQRAILDATAPCIAPQGRIVYSTCSVEPEENTQQVHAFLNRHPEFMLVTERQLIPCAAHDGAYAALLKRRE